MADEATAALDAASALQVSSAILGLDCMTRIVVTHSLDAALLRAYLARTCAHGETVELWHLWVGGEAHRVRRFSGPLSALERDTLEQLAEHPQTCLTITI